MWKKILLIQFLIMALTANVNASRYGWADSYFPLTRELESVRMYEGDRHGEFTDDFVAVLNDGSHWKIHAKDAEKFGMWQPGDQVHVALRTSFYWFKREHKFELVNHTLGQKVRVMLVKYSNNPLSILNTSTVITKCEQFKHSTNIESGARSTDIYWWRHFYIKTIHLNDGSLISVEGIYESEQCFNQFLKSPDPFIAGLKVYLGCNENPNDVRYFIVTGIEREAQWRWVSWNPY